MHSMFCIFFLAELRIFVGVHQCVQFTSAAYFDLDDPTAVIRACINLSNKSMRPKLDF